jgi:hypothetical protein
MLAHYFRYQRLCGHIAKLVSGFHPDIYNALQPFRRYACYSASREVFSQYHAERWRVHGIFFYDAGQVYPRRSGVAAEQEPVVSAVVPDCYMNFIPFGLLDFIDAAAG